MRISLCTTCCNRLHQFRQTFPSNANIVTKFSSIQWVVLNYNSRDNLDDFIYNQVERVPNLVYARDSSGRTWHASVAKNIAHTVASGDILVNFDCDNYIDNLLSTVARSFAAGASVVHNWSGTYRDGTFGRIAINRHLFSQLGGYDEALQPMGHQDHDLLNRASAFGIRVEHLPCAPGAALLNTKDEAISNCDCSHLTWHDLNRANKRRSDENIRAGRLIANNGSPTRNSRVEIIFPKNHQH